MVQVHMGAWDGTPGSWLQSWLLCLCLLLSLSPGSWLQSQLLDLSLLLCLYLSLSWLLASVLANGSLSLSPSISLFHLNLSAI